MTVDLKMPGQLGRQAPGAPYIPPKPFVFTEIPGLKDLLPEFRGLPGFEYLQCCVINLRRAQDEGWVEVENTFIYTCQGPKGSVDMKLLARGQRIPGTAHNSGARLCLCDRTVEALTGLWINPKQHLDEAPPEDTTLSSATQNEDPATPDAVDPSQESPQVYVGGTPKGDSQDAAQ